MKILGLSYGNNNDLHFQIIINKIGIFKGVLYFKTCTACITTFKPKSININTSKIYNFIEDFLFEKDFKLINKDIFKQRNKTSERDFRYYLLNKYSLNGPD